MKYFQSDEKIPIVNTMLAHCESSEQLRLVVSAEIIEKIIGELLYDPEDLLEPFR
jgi:hypothetical protein